MTPFDPYHKWLGIPETERPISKYRLLGIADFEADRDVIGAAAERQTIYLRTLQAGEHELLVAQLLNEISRARVTLLNADQKAEYDQQLQVEMQPALVPIPALVQNDPLGIVTEQPTLPVRQPSRRREKTQPIWQQPRILAAAGAVAVVLLFIFLNSGGEPQVPNTDNPEERKAEVSRLVGERVKQELVQAEKERLAKEKAEAERLTAAEATAGKTSRGGTDTVYALNEIGIVLRKIPAGTFMMGSPEGETGRRNEERQHTVTISKAFYIQNTEVTQYQWKAVMGTEPWKGKSYVKEGPDYPAVYVSWGDAVTFCKRASASDRKTFRLPTEAEWEYACRAGSMTAWSFGDDEKVLGDYAWYKGNAWDIDEKYARQVGLKNPNAFGLYDMHGNVEEWCSGYYRAEYYTGSPVTDPQGPSRSDNRVFRGGSFVGDPRYARSANRNWTGRKTMGVPIGFRVVRELD